MQVAAVNDCVPETNSEEVYFVKVRLRQINPINVRMIQVPAPKNQFA